MLALVRTSQRRIERSPEADARTLPSGEKDTSSTSELWPGRVWRVFPEAVSHSLTVLSSEQEARRLLLLGQKATALTGLVWPRKVCRTVGCGTT